MIDDSLAGEALATIEELASGDLETRRRSAEALALCGEHARPAAVALVLAAGDDDEIVREYAVAALESIGRPAVEDRESLLSIAADEEARDDSVYWAVTLLARLGQEAVDDRVRETLMRLCLHGSEAVRRRTRWAIRELG